MVAAVSVVSLLVFVAYLKLSKFGKRIREQGDKISILTKEIEQRKHETFILKYMIKNRQMDPKSEDDELIYETFTCPCLSERPVLTKQVNLSGERNLGAFPCLTPADSSEGPRDLPA